VSIVRQSLVVILLQTDNIASRCQKLLHFLAVFWKLGSYLAEVVHLLSAAIDRLPSELNSAIFWQSAQTIADLDASSKNPSIKFEANQKLRRLDAKFDVGPWERSNGTDRRLLAQDPTNPQKQKAVADSDQKLKNMQDLQSKWNSIKSNAALVRTGFDQIYQNSINATQIASFETRIQWLEEVMAGKSLDPVRSIINAVMERNTDSNSKYPWKDLPEGDRRLSLLRVLADDPDVRTAAAANLMLSGHSMVLADKNKALEKLDELSEKGGKQIHDELRFRLMDAHGRRANTYATFFIKDGKIGDLDEALRHLDLMIKYDRQLDSKLSPRCQALIKAHHDLLKEAAKKVNESKDKEASQRIWICLLHFRTAGRVEHIA